MKLHIFFAIPIFVFSCSIRALNLDDVETCSIKAETPCSGPLEAGAKSYTFNLGSSLDADKALKDQLRIYQDLHKKLQSEASFPIFVHVTSTKNYRDLIKEKLKTFLKKPIAKKFHSLSKVSFNEILVKVESMDEMSRLLVFENVPLSRFEIPNEAYTEWVFTKLKKIFNNQKNITVETLNEEQKASLVRYGAVALLCAQEYAKNVKLKKD